MNGLDFHCLDILDIHKAEATRIRAGRSGVRGPAMSLKPRPALWPI